MIQNPFTPTTFENFEVVSVVGVASILLDTGVITTANSYGWFLFDKWHFTIVQSVEFPDCFSVVETSTGAMISDYCYYSLKQAVKESKTYLMSKRYELSTKVQNLKVSLGVNVDYTNQINYSHAIYLPCL